MYGRSCQLISIFKNWNTKGLNYHSLGKILIFYTDIRNTGRYKIKITTYVRCVLCNSMHKVQIKTRIKLNLYI